MACIQCWEILLLTIGELMVELHVGASGIYNIRSSVLSYQFYIITYTLDNIFRFILICMLLWQCDASFPNYSLVLCLHSMHPPLGNYQ